MGLSNPKFEAAVLDMLQNAETDWNGFTDPKTLAHQICELAMSDRDVVQHQNSRPRQKIDTPPSTEFEDAFADGHGTISATCELCGRTLFTRGVETDGSKGEWEELTREMEIDPEKYILMAEDMVSLASIEGKHTILGCPCNGLRRYEDFIWNERIGITDYLAAIARKKLREAKELAEQTEQARVCLKRLEEPDLPF